MGKTMGPQGIFLSANAMDGVLIVVDSTFGDNHSKLWIIFYVISLPLVHWRVML